MLGCQQILSKANITLVTITAIILLQSHIQASIKAQLSFTKPNVTQELIKDKELFARHGLKLVNDNPDVILCDEFNASSLLALDIPLIICEYSDSASLTYHTRSIIGHENIKAVFKNWTLKPMSLNNEPICFDTYHFRRVNDYAQRAQNMIPRQLSTHELAKIQQVIWYKPFSVFSERQEALKDYTIDYLQERPIDASFVGSVIWQSNLDVYYDLFMWHREQAATTLEDIQNIKCFVCVGNNLSYSEYIDIIRRSKIVISPWGFCEWCHRDSEAIFNGALLIKPDTSFVQTTPNLYQNNLTYVPCKPDFSDLEEKIHHILNNYDDYIEMRQRAKDLLCQSWDVDLLAAIFVNQIQMALRP